MNDPYKSYICEFALPGQRMVNGSDTSRRSPLPLIEIARVPSESQIRIEATFFAGERRGRKWGLPEGSGERR